MRTPRLLISLCILGACLLPRFAVSAGDSVRRPNVVLITIDTLRADHLQTYGYARPTSAGIDDFFRNAVVFENAISTSSWTAPAMASLFTARHPHQHGVRRGFVPGFFAGKAREALFQEKLGESVTTLVEILAAHGYDTLGLSTNPHLTEGLGFGQGFRQYRWLRADPADPGVGKVYADAAALGATAAQLRARMQPQKPAFIWLHYVDPHWPYRAQQPWLGAYASEILGREIELPASVMSPKPLRELGLDEPQSLALYEAYYDGEIHFVMQQLGKLLDELDLGANTLTVLTSDHGESFFEHGLLGHSVSLYEPEVRIPLLFRLPEADRRSLRVPTPVSLLDVMPTILDYLALPIDAGIAGRSLLPLIRDPSKNEPRPLYGELSRGRPILRFARLGRWKLIANLSEDREELYDVEADPAERNDLLGSGTAPYARLKVLLMRYNREAEQPPRAETKLEALDDEAREALEALGYTAGD